MEWPKLTEGPLSPHQIEQYERATSRGNLAILGGSPGTGKAQPLTSRVLTPTGWTQMGAITPGDLVISRTGLPVQVVGVFTQGVKDVVRVHFSDGTSTRCCLDHLWSTQTHSEKKTKKGFTVKSTRAIRDTLLRSDGRHNHSIPMVLPVEFRPQPLPIDPYLLGILLGDGCFRGGTPRITCPDEFIISEARQRLPHGLGLVQSKTRPIDWAITAGNLGGASNPLTESLRALGLWGRLSTDKHIPHEYLFAPSQVRLAVLNGLLDTDGSTDGHNVEYSTSSPILASDLSFLVESFGGTTSVAIRKPKFTYNGEEKIGADSYRVLVKLPAAISPFRLPRKLEKYIRRSKYQPSRRIVAIEEDGREECQCILVDSIDHLYVTDCFIVTHNTFTAAQIIKAVGNQIGFGGIGVGAPTGKAAVRLTEAMAAYRLPLRASTWHSLLKVEQADTGGGWSFAHNAGNPLPFTFLVGDESSMLDTDLAASIFSARARGTKFLCIGDINQLPPVGHGAPLRDMIAAGLPYGELREIRRNEGGIVQACADIRDGQPFQCEGNLRLVEAWTPGEQQDRMLETISDGARAFGVDPIWGVQVLVAVNKAGELSRQKINKILQNMLNPNPEVQGTPFRWNDKVINTKNGFFRLVQKPPRLEGCTFNSAGEVYVANGEMGEAVVVEPGKMHVRVQSPERLIVVPRGKASDSEKEDDEEGATNTGCKWELGYAISTHKSQGSAWPIVVVMLDDSGSALNICTREHLYTSISRAERCCYLVGKMDTARRYCRGQAIDKRKTFLRERILQQLSSF